MKSRLPLLIIGAVALVLAYALSFAQKDGAFFQSYLFAWIFWLGLSAGSIALLLMHQLTAGKWGTLLQPMLASASATMLPVAILIVPVLLGMSHLYPWLHPHGEEGHTLAAKAAWLNAPFFLVRTAFYLGIWVLLSWMGRRIGAGISLVLYFLTASFAAVDWIMSLEPHWFSTTYGLIFIVAQAMSALAFAIAAMVLGTKENSSGLLPDPPRGRDLGNLLLATTMIWTYLNFMQYLIIWSGNLPEEVTWVQARSSHGWQWIVLVLALLQFALPFFVLLFRDAKERSDRLVKVAILILMMRIVDVYWFVVPAFGRDSALPRLSDVLCLAGIGAIWLWCYLGANMSKEIPA